MTNRTKSRVFCIYILHALGIPIAIAIVGIIIGYRVGDSNYDQNEGLIQWLVIAGLFVLAAAMYAFVYQIWWWVTRVEEHLELTRQIAQAHQPAAQEPSQARDNPQSQPPHSHEVRRKSATPPPVRGLERATKPPNLDNALFGGGAVLALIVIAIVLIAYLVP